LRHSRWVLIYGVSYCSQGIRFDFVANAINAGDRLRTSANR